MESLQQHKRIAPRPPGSMNHYLPTFMFLHSM